MLARDANYHTPTITLTTPPAGLADRVSILARTRAGVSKFTFEAMVRGYHVYHEIWTAAVGEELSCIRETGPLRSLL